MDLATCHLARRYGCRVVGVDLSERMVEWARKRAQRKGLADRVEFRVADVQDLPFEDARFDAVLSESVTAFPPDKDKAVREYVRVTRPGGCVGLNEGTWVQRQQSLGQKNGGALSASAPPVAILRPA